VSAQSEATVFADGLSEPSGLHQLFCSADVQRAFRGAPVGEIYTTACRARKKKA